MSKPYAELRNMSKEELIINHDSNANGVVMPPNYWLNEIERRDRTDHENTMMKYTSQIRWMTVIMTTATIVNIVLFLLKR